MAELPTFLIDGQDVPMDKLRAFLARLSGQASAALLNTVDGAKPFATLAAAQAAPAVTAGAQARVFNDATAANNGLYVNKTGAVGGYVLDAAFYGAVANVLNPLVQRADDASAAAAAVAAALSGVPVGLPIGGNENEINAPTVPTPDVGGKFDILIAKTNTSATFLTAGGLRRQVVNAGAAPVGAGSVVAGQIASFELSGGGGFVLTKSRAAGPEKIVSGTDGSAFVDKPFGDITYAANGTRTIAQIERYVVVPGSSNAHPDYVGATRLPANVAAAALNEFSAGDGILFKGETVAEPGAPFVTIAAQLAKSTSYAAGTAKWVLPCYGMNECRTIFYNAQGGVKAQLAAARAQVIACRAVGVEMALNTIFPPDLRASDVSLDPQFFADATVYNSSTGAKGTTTDQDYPVKRAAPVNPESQMVPAASKALTPARAWTSTGVKRRGYRRIWDWNRRIRRLAAELDCVLLDYFACTYRNIIEMVPDLGTGLDLFYNKANPLHPLDALYDAGVTPVIREWALAVAQGRTDQKVFRGESQGMLALPLLGQGELGSAVANNGKLARISYEGSDALVVAQGGAWRALQTGGALKVSFSFANGPMPAGATLARPAGTASRINSALMIDYTTGADIARFDFDPNANVVGGLLIEPNRTNTHIQSEVNQTGWIREQASLTPNALIQQIGAPNLTKLAASTGVVAGSVIRVYQQANDNDPAKTYTKSYYCKRGTDGYKYLWLTRDGGDTVCFNMDTGLFESVGPGITASAKALPNGVYRVSLRVKGANIGGNNSFFWLSDRPNALSVGSATPEGTFCYVGGAQCEEAMWASSYIPTTTTALTRPADTLTLDWGSLGVPDSTITARYTFDDGSTQDVATVVASGKSAVAGGALNRFCIRRVELVTA